jgi:hypothetical protein
MSVYGFNPYNNVSAWGNGPAVNGSALNPAPNNNFGGFQTPSANNVDVFQANPANFGNVPGMSAGFDPGYFSGVYTSRAGNAVNGELEDKQVSCQQVLQTALKDCSSVKPLEKGVKVHKPDDSGYYEALGLNETSI